MNPSDNLKKVEKRNRKLAELLKTNYFNLAEQACVERDIKKSQETSSFQVNVDKSVSLVKEKMAGVSRNVSFLDESNRSLPG